MDICQRQAIDEVAPCVLQYGKDSGAIWASMQTQLPENFAAESLK